jgi:hypothetical protein
MAITDGGNPEPAAVPGSFVETLHIERDRYPLTALFTDPQADFWLWDYVEGGDESGRTFDFNVPGVAGMGEVSLTLYFKGATSTANDPDHAATVYLNGSPIGGTSWDGLDEHPLPLTFSAGLLQEGANTLRIVGHLTGGVDYSIFYLDSLDLTYQRLFRADGDRFIYRSPIAEVVTVDGFSAPEIRVFDITDPDHPARLSNLNVDGGFRVSFTTLADHSYLAVGPAGYFSPAWVKYDRPSRLTKTKRAVDYLIITASGLERGTRELARLQTRRGLRTKVVDIEEIYDDFNDGLASPLAIHRFLSHASENWSNPGPAYVALAGDGTYDYKDNLARGDCLIPGLMVSTPYGLFTSDGVLADIRGNDGIPDLAIGRLPVLTDGELLDYVRKVKRYQMAAGSWTSRILMLADNKDIGGDFPVDSDRLSNMVPASLELEKVYISHLGHDLARQMTLDIFNAGAKMVNYIGHGGLNYLAGERLLQNDDLVGLFNGDRLPIFTAFSCVVGRFSVPGYETLSEALLRKPDGGALVVWAPTGASVNSQAMKLANGLFSALFEEGRREVGSAVRRAMEAYRIQGGPVFLPKIYNLLGDPAIKIK